MGSSLSGWLLQKEMEDLGGRVRLLFFFFFVFFAVPISEDNKSKNLKNLFPTRPISSMARRCNRMGLV